MSAWIDGQGYDALAWLCTTNMMSLHTLVYLAGVAALGWLARRWDPVAQADVWAAGALGLIGVLALGYLPDGWRLVHILPAGPADLLLRFTALEINAERLDEIQAGAGAASLGGLVWIRLAWAAGVAFVLTRVLRDWIGAARLTVRARPVTDPAWLAALAAVRSDLRVARPVRLVESDEIGTPMTWGWLAPVVLVPADALHWAESERRAALVHEMAHVRRLDTPLFTLGHLAAAWFWFHPMVWWGLHRWQAAREEACDRAVLRAGVRVSSYARLLMALSRVAGPRGGGLVVAAGMARSSQVYRRVSSVLEAPAPSAERLPRTAQSLLGALLLGLILAMGTLRAWPTRAVMEDAARSGGWKAEVAARLEGTAYLLNHTDPPPR